MVPYAWNLLLTPPTLMPGVLKSVISSRSGSTPACGTCRPGKARLGRRRMPLQEPNNPLPLLVQKLWPAPLGQDLYPGQ
jgi:hypothetical protein